MGHFGASGLLRPRRVPSEVRWGMVAPFPETPDFTARVAPLRPLEGLSLGAGLPYLDHRAPPPSPARVARVGPALPSASEERVHVMGPPSGSAPRSPSPQLQFRLEPIGRAPSPAPHG